MIKKILYIILPFLLLSCEKIYINGDLDGMWRLERIETENETIYPEGVYYSFQRHLVMLGIYSETEQAKNRYKACFTHADGKIVMDNFYRYPGTSGVCDTEELAALYIFDTHVEFTVEELCSERMVLLTDGMSYVFRKW